MRRHALAFALAFALSLAWLAACSEEPPPSAPANASRSTTNPDAWFVDATAESGVDFVHRNGATEHKHLPETMGGGGALADVDGDGDLDLFLLQSGPMRLGGERPGSFMDPPGELPTHRLYVNDGRGRFSDATARIGAAADTAYAMGLAAGDCNGDGHVDFYVTSLGADKLLINDGTGSFRDATAQSGIREDRWTSGATFFDADGDRDLDLFVCAYVEVDLRNPEWCGERRPGYRSYCHPDRYAGLPDRFWRNRGDGTFEDATESAGFGSDVGKGLGAIAGDFDGDGDLDLYIANDSTENTLWENDGTGNFSDATLLAGVGVDAHGLTEASMGQASGDLDGDLDPELVVTNFDDESDTFYFNLGGLSFEDRTIQIGLEAITRLPVGFGTVFCDFDEDGDFDWVVANGHIIDNIELYDDAKTYAQRSMLCVNDGKGKFRELAAEAGPLRERFWVGRGLYSGDLDGDGDLDLVLTQCGRDTAVLRNQRGRGDAVAIHGLPPHTRVICELRSGRKLAREAGPQPSYFGACAPSVHVGLAGDALVAIEVRPPYRDAARFALDAPLERGALDARVADGVVQSITPRAR